MVAVEVAEGVALRALQVLRIHEEHRAHVRRLADRLVEGHAESEQAVEAALVAREVGRVGLLGVGLELRRRERPRDAEQVARAGELDADPAAPGGGCREAADELRARGVGVLAPAVEGGAGEREPALGRAHARAHASHGAQHAEAPRLLGELAEIALEERHGTEAHDAAGGIAPGGTAVGAEHLDPLDGREVDLVEGRAAIRFRLGNAVEQDPDAARRPGVGPVTGASCAEAADRQTDVMGAEARLREHARHLLQRLVHAETGAAGPLVGGEDRDGEGDLRQAARFAGRSHHHSVETRAGGVASLRLCEQREADDQARRTDAAVSRRRHRYGSGQG